MKNNFSEKPFKILTTVKYQNIKSFSFIFKKFIFIFIVQVIGSDISRKVSLI